MTQNPDESEAVDWLEGWAYRLRWLILVGMLGAWLNFLNHVLSDKAVKSVLSLVWL